MRNYGSPVQPYTGIANPTAQQILTSGIRGVLFEFTSPQLLLIELTDENTARGNELAAAVAALADAHDLVNRLRVGNNAESRAIAQVALENAIIAEKAATKARVLSEMYEVAATQQTMLASINPLGIGETESDPTACFKFAGTSFQGTCTFEFPVATFTAGVAPRFWQVGNTTHVGTHNFLSVACTPFMFQANQDGTIPIANLNGAGVTHANALHLTTVPACIFDISQVSAEGTVTCKYDFEKTMIDTRGRDTTNNVDGTKFYVPGYTFALGRGEDIKSNVLADYNTNANLDAGNTAQDLRDIYGLKQFIGNRFPVPAGNLIFAERLRDVYISVRLHLRDPIDHLGSPVRDPGRLPCRRGRSRVYVLRSDAHRGPWRTG